MKSILVLLSIFAFAKGQDVTLAQKWNLTEPTFEYDANRFNLTFKVTDFINTGMAKYSLWTAPDCQEGGVNIEGSNAWEEVKLVENENLLAANDFDGDDTTMLESGDYTGDRAAIVTAKFASQNISNATNIYTETETNGQISAEIRFCIRFGLWTTEDMGVDTPVEVNFLETLVTLIVDLTDGFQIGEINVEPKDRLVRTANQAYEVNGYECSADSTDRANNANPRNQGEIIYICVTPEEEAQTDGIFMRSIDEFTFTRGPAGEDQIRQNAVEDNRAAANLLTSFDYAACEGALVCRFSTILFAQFYLQPGTVSGEGVASMQFGNTQTGNTRRLLRGNDNELEQQRDLQQDEGAGAAEFELSFDVAEGQLGAGTSDASKIGATLSFGALAVVAALW